ncbi:MAG: aldehyde dehydrogenase family protein [Candidatus Cloacimonetes bacterium]|nr:aldehyde dehydrogenase family protein [Candidatus Cloacimonadota bacterium]
MNEDQKYADELLERASIAAAEFSQLEQEQVDRIVEAVFRAAFSARVKLARMALEETQLGVWQDKVLKNVVASQLVYESIKHEKTVGVISTDELTGITEIAQPLGPIFAVTPVTNPTSTVIYKILICLKTRNPVIISPHRRARNCSIETARICYEAALQAGAPEDCILWISRSSRDLTHACMTDPRLALILATGGTGLVTAAYSSGTPALGVGPGNVPVFIDESADIPFAIASIITSKCFDNGTVCASEQAIVTTAGIAEAVKAELMHQKCFILNNEEISQLEHIAVNPETGMMSSEIVGQSVKKIAEMAGLDIPPDTRILIAPLPGVGSAYPLSGEILAPVLAFYVEPDYISAIKTCIDLNYLGGIGHTVSIYANDETRIAEFSELMNAGRVVVNTPSSQGAVGGIFNTLHTSFTLGCGAGGKNITTENISALHLINIKRICRRRDNHKWCNFDMNRYLQEDAGLEDIINEYNKNQ